MQLSLDFMHLQDDLRGFDEQLHRIVLHLVLQAHGISSSSGSGMGSNDDSWAWFQEGTELGAGGTTNGHAS